MKSLPFLLLVLFFSSCSGFRSEWERAVATPVGQPLEGAWEGKWKSEVNGHEGDLRCLVGPDSSHEREFWYWASWSIFSGSFKAVHEIEVEADGAYQIEGAKDLGPLLGGAFSQKGRIEGDQFEARYDSKLDRGWMRMEKVR